ncbi:NERD domain-containing protein [Pseudoalteromonas sp. DL2-H2.2]|uniref:NERD domain-containing protein n=1 Tax=Pseudoalteromonas sp. DL2-H2.2 TaxID=2908889 RepID=UPI001F174938|nr:NERD domain-containing protein [Pseudoalteromonas sp. DL2-H2.2]MCF2906741.1 NERD domain-containing protein [Pseudoalteromonas sp. DL2-H2.2]
MIRWILVCLLIVGASMASAAATTDNTAGKDAQRYLLSAAPEQQTSELAEAEVTSLTGSEFSALNLIALCFVAYLVWTLGRYLLVRKRDVDKAEADRLKWQVYQSLATSLDAKNYTIISRHLYPNQLDALSVDCVVLSPFGVFVVVVAEQSGLIAIETDSQVWPCRHKNKTHYLANPLTAAAQRAATLAGILNTPFGVRWIVVFPDDAEFSPTRPPDCCKVSEVSLDILRYTRCQFSHEQVRIFEQGVLSYGEHNKRLSA